MYGCASMRNGYKLLGKRMVGRRVFLHVDRHLKHSGLSHGMRNSLTKAMSIRMIREKRKARFEVRVCYNHPKEDFVSLFLGLQETLSSLTSAPRLNHWDTSKSGDESVREF